MMIQLPDGRWVRADNLCEIGSRRALYARLLAPSERDLTEQMCYVIPQLDEAKRAIARDPGASTVTGDDKPCGAR